jgi:polysaccharide export outer membrane protein
VTARTVRIAVVGMAALVLSAPFSTAQQAPVVATGCPGEYVIGHEDVVEIAVWNNTSITRTVPVRPDGKISLPLLNDVQAAGLTAMQLRDRLTASLAEYMPTPSVSVIVREVHSFKVTVIGQVKTPGRYELKGRATVLDVLALAGGLTEFAERNGIVVMRPDGPVTRRIPFQYASLASSNGRKNPKPGEENFCLHPGDIVFVP